MNNKTLTVETNLYCEECGNIVTIRRRESLQKEIGHVKHMYCFRCIKTTGHIEIKNRDIYEAKKEV